MYFLYSAFYAIVTIGLEKLTGKFWGMELNLKNFLITPFLNGHQFDLSCPMWFVPQLFITMIVFLFLQRQFRGVNNRVNQGENEETSEWIKAIFYFAIGFAAIPLAKIFPVTPVFLVLISSMFFLLFVYLGHFYIKKIHNNYNIFTP